MRRARQECGEGVSQTPVRRVWVVNGDVLVQILEKKVRRRTQANIYITLWIHTSELTNAGIPGEVRSSRHMRAASRWQCRARCIRRCSAGQCPCAIGHWRRNARETRMIWYPTWLSERLTGQTIDTASPANCKSEQTCHQQVCHAVASMSGRTAMQ